MALKFYSFYLKKAPTLQKSSYSPIIHGDNILLIAIHSYFNLLPVLSAPYARRKRKDKQHKKRQKAQKLPESALKKPQVPNFTVRVWVLFSSIVQ